MNNRLAGSIAVIGIVGASALAGCGGSSDGQSGASGASDTVKVVYHKTDTSSPVHHMLESAKAEFEKEYPEYKASLEPVAASESEYATKVALMNGSAATAPDVIYEDTFQVRSDAAAGYLAPLDKCVDSWDEWDQFEDSAKDAGRGDDGQVYGVSLGTEMRAIYYNKNLFKEAGLPTDWQPKTWNDVLAAAEKIHEKLPDVTPLNIYTTKAQGEATSMQGFEMLLYGTGDGLYDEDSQKWIVGSKGFVESLQFLKDLTDAKATPTVEQMLDTNVGEQMVDGFTKDKVAMLIDGSWKVGTWMKDGHEKSWPEWQDVVGIAKMPTSDGQEPGAVSMSGGWLLSIGSHVANYDAACDFLKIALNAENSKLYDTLGGEIAVRKDVAADPEYQSYNPTNEFFSSLVPYTNFRPATPDYPVVSDQIQIASEKVVTGQATPEEAAAEFDAAVTKSLGEDKVTKAN